MAKKLAYDKVLFSTVIVLMALGLTMVYSASAAYARANSQPANQYLVKQALAAGLGLVAMWVAMHVDYRHLRRPWVVYSLVGGVLLLLVAALWAPELNQTRRWLFVGGVSVQPAELAKLAVVPFVAYQIERKGQRERQRDLVLPCALLLAIMASLVLLQPDLGTAVLLCAAVVLMLVLAGLRWRYLLGGMAVLVPALAVFVLSAEYRVNRLIAFLYPDANLDGLNYQVAQSLIAVGSGGLLGVGLGQSVQKLLFLPHAHSDFIYSIVAEELGMAGALGVLALFGVLAWRGFAAGWRAPDEFGKYLAWGFTGLLLIQALVHVSVALQLLPAKGIPLPLISYGGSSLVVSLTACGVVLNVSEHA